MFSHVHDIAEKKTAKEHFQYDGLGSEETAMIKKIIFHIGAPKTGSSSIQLTLLNSRELLEAENILYPKGWMHNHGSILFSKFFDAPTNLLFHKLNNNTEEEIEEFHRHYFSILSTEITESQAKTLLLSGEVLSELDIGSIEKMKAYFTDNYGVHDFAVYYFVRHPVSYWTSLCCQMSQHGANKIDDFLQKHDYLVFEKVINNYANVFGSAKVKVLKFEDACKHPFGPSGFFLKEIGFSEEKISLLNDTFIYHNAANSDKTIDINDYINSRLLLVGDKGTNKGRYWGDTKFFNNLKGCKFSFDGAVKKNIYDLSLKDSLYLKENYGINYTEMPDLGDSPVMIFDAQYVLDIIEIFAYLSTVIQKLLYDYLNDRLKIPKLDNESRYSLKFLSLWVEKNFSHIAETPLDILVDRLDHKISYEYKNFNELMQALKTPNRQALEFKYYAISLFLQEYSQYGSAFYFAEKAQSLAPERLDMSDNCEKIKKLLII